MSIHEYRLIAIFWSILILFLTVFWYFTLSRLSEVVRERLKAIKSHQAPPAGLPGFFNFIIRGEYRGLGDDRLIAVCARLKRLLYGYLGSIIAYIVFLSIVRSRL